MMWLLLAVPITLQSTLQHILDEHSHIPRPVQVRAATHTPAESHALYNNTSLPPDYVPPIGWVYPSGWGWQIEVRQSEARTMSHRLLEWVLMHEVCHIILDFDRLPRWGQLPPAERQQREASADECANLMQHQHWSGCQLAYPNPLRRKRGSR